MNMNEKLALATLASSIVEALLENQAASKEASEAAKGRRDNVAQAVRAYATETAEKDVSVEDTIAAFRLAATAAELPSGTVKGYSASLKGYRHLLSEGEDISEVNTKEAQEAVASDEVKALNAARKRLRDATKDKKVWTAARLIELAEFAEEMAKEASEADAPTAAETAEVREAIAA